MYILGWEIDFGHLEAVNLISSQKYSEKQIVSSNLSSNSIIIWVLTSGCRATWQLRFCFTKIVTLYDWLLTRQKRI